jgi:hypothetical protein
MEAPLVKANVQGLKTPLNFDQVVYIYNALLSQHINIYDIPADVFSEFRQTRQYRSFFKRMMV